MTIITKNLTNYNIYNIATAILNLSEDIVLPIKVNFYLQKNKKAFQELGSELENQRMKIITTYGKYNEETQNYIFDDIPFVNKKIDELFSLEQEVKIYKVSLEDFGDINLSSKEFSALEFMIIDEEEE